jgi:hypothetical protein
MAVYTCPVCSNEVPRDLVVFLDHTNQHIFDEIRKAHPELVDQDGICKGCVEYLQGQIQNPE